jgi:tetratricopeptide (TPR) repeat protein
LREAEELLPDVADTYIVEAELFANMGEGDNAVKTMNRAIERFPEDPSLYVVLARILNTSEKYTEALSAIKKANEIAGRDLSVENREAALQLGITYAGLRDIDKSIAALQAACAKNPDDNDLAYLLMSECYSEKRYVEARSVAKDILAKDDVLPRYRAAALYNEVICDKALGEGEDIEARLNELTKILRKITIADPGLMDVYVYRLLVYKELGWFDKANEMADHLIGVAPKNATGYAFKADIAAAQGDEASANVCKQKVLEIDPNFKF